MSGTWLRSLRRSGAACAVATSAVLAAANTGCAAHAADGEAQHGPRRAVLTTTFRLAGIAGVATGGGAAWATTGNALLRIDPRTDRARQFLADPGASLTGVAFGAGSLWVEGTAGIMRVDPGTGRVTARIGVHASALSFGEGALWTMTDHVTRSYLPGAQLVRIDPVTNAVRTFPLPSRKTWGLAAGEGAVWVSATCPAFGCLLRVDPATGRVTARIPGSHLFGQVTVGDGAVWASDGAAVTRIDPRTNRVAATVPLLSPAPMSDLSPVLNGSGLLAAASGVVWVTRAGNTRHASLLRIDPRTGRVTGAGLAVGREPQAVVASGTTAWVMTATGLARADLVPCVHGRCVRAAAPASLPAAPAPAWLHSLQMVSARDGWALAWTSNPASPLPAGLIPVRTTDGGRTWTAVTPTQARPLLAAGHVDVILQPLSASRASLAATATRSQGGYGIHPARTVIFATADEGRSWTRSAPVLAPGNAGWLALTDPAHGWLLQSLGAAMEQNPVQLYRTSDGGRRWSLIAASPRWNQAGTSPSGLPIACDKTGIAFATRADGWLTSACLSLADAVLATRDGGAHWAPQPLPLPASTCAPGLCLIYPPQFFGPTGFLTIDHGGKSPYLLVSHDTGATWHAEPVPPAAGPLGSAHFFDARHGLLIPAVEQDTPGQVFYVTADGGQTWTPVRQGLRFQPGMTVDFPSPEAGFAWNPNATGAPPIYATTNGGRTWTWYLPRLAQNGRPAGAGTPARFEPAAVSFVSPAQGWVLGRGGCQDCAALRVTRDGGAHWSVLPAPPAPLGYHSRSANAVTNVAFADQASGFLYGPGLLATHDGGRSWTHQPLPPVQTLAVGAGHAYALTRDGGSVSLWRTAIGSGLWARLSLPPGAGRPSNWGNGTQLYAEAGALVLLRPGSPSQTVTPGQAGQLWVSRNNGTGWQARPVPCLAPSGGGAAVLSIARDHPDAWLLDCFNNEQSSQEQNTQHHLYGTADGGLSWVRLPDPTGHNMPVLLADNGSGHAFLATEGGSDTLVGTFNYGRHWHPVLRDGGSFFGWAGLSFVTAETGFVVGPTHYAPEHLYRTDDGGRTWRALRF
jgi:photosystem II stability/assembly factor-like uncharacterized protein